MLDLGLILLLIVIGLLIRLLECLGAERAMAYRKRMRGL